MATQEFDSSSDPSEAALATALAAAIKDHNGADVSFGSLLSAEDGHKTIVIFIRHFYCGLCQDFLSFLTSKVKPDLLQSHNTKLIIIGCGEFGLLDGYKALIDSPYDIYADPDLSVYTPLGMTRRTLDQGKFGANNKPEYLVRSVNVVPTAFSNIVTSIRNVFKMGKPMANSGDIRQLGGEFVFDSQKRAVFVHRMENTRGHAKLAEILGAAGVPYESA
ncbi:BZ3500_MvSof-1268-A1-R1_Chr3-1g05570 [Microbotryum saponariae]|uniref:BZ3500_MvSof-1268-A1-R1_Chr3-1g05570 protein n=1 Tax=Microbotryum saponariae TaxID=289078 RepID=A0A2X0N0M5_9BASI|nr:BZ3500_MvSof-1268-A1-R1_Chr3-1g05570 [Microbotryum saponariae]SDA04760.1 BZ3501_MvSof-1269-A2-R1_Chr3-1g05240 [Microbotryum saponariae]